MFDFRTNWVSHKTLSTMGLCLCGVARRILAPWWTISRKWTFSMCRILYLSYLTERRRHKEAKRQLVETKAFWTSLQWTKISARTLIKRKLNKSSKKIIKLVKYKLSALYFVMRIRLISSKPRRCSTCSEKSLKMSP